MAPYLLTATLRYRASLHRILISSQMFPFILNYLRGVQPPLRDMSEVCLVFAFINRTHTLCRRTFTCSSGRPSSITSTCCVL